MRQTLVDLAMDLPIHPTALDPRNGLPLRAIGRTSRGPIWPVMGAEDNPPPAPVPVPAPPAVPPGYVPQDQVNAIAAREKEQGERRGLRAAIEALGLDPETTKLEDVKTILAAAEQRRQQEESDAQRVAREAAEATARATRAQADAAADQLAAKKQLALVAGNAKVETLADAALLLPIQLDSTPEAVTAAVEALKTRLPALFGTAATPPPPPPGGAPLGTPPAATPPGDAWERGRQRALGGQQQPAATSTMFADTH